MARYQAVIETPLSPAAAFAFMRDVTNFATWDPGVVRAVKVAGEGFGLGAAYDLTVKAGTTTVMRYEVAHYDEPRHLRLVSTTRRVTSVDDIYVEATAQGARVTYAADLRLNGWLNAFDAVLALAFRRIGDRAAAGLRIALTHAT